MNYAVLKQRINQGRNGEEILSIPPNSGSGIILQEIELYEL